MRADDLKGGCAAVPAAKPTRCHDRGDGKPGGDPRTIRILLVEDCAGLRRSIRQLLETDPGVEVVDETDDGEKAVRLARRHAPDMVLMDITLRKLNGVDATARILALQPETKIIALSGHDFPSLVDACFKVGMKGYILKRDVSEVAIAIQEVLARGRYLSPRLALGGRDLSQDVPPDRDSPFVILSPTQRQIVQLIAEGMRSRGIADYLGIAEATVEVHRRDILQRLAPRLGVENVADLVRYAVREGLASAAWTKAEPSDDTRGAQPTRFPV